MYRTTLLILIFLSAGIVLPGRHAHAAIAIIVHPSITLKTVDVNDVRRLFLGKTKLLANLLPMVPLNLTADQPAREEFNRKVIKKSESQLKAYWVKLIFTGKGTPPRAFKNSEEVINLVAHNVDMIGFINTDEVNESVRVLLIIE